MMELIKKKPHREPLELQLTAMIDIFSMLVIFLIFGTVIGATEFLVPKDLVLPLSTSKESTELAAQLVISPSQVIISVPENTEMNLNQFLNDAVGPKVAALVEKIHNFLESESKKNKTTTKVLNVIAHKGLKYRDFFNVIKVFKGAGFDNILLIAQDDGGKPAAKN
jgi:biopolymer transport protein ExbD